MEHHAYLCEGPLALLPALAADARERFGMGGPSDPDVSVEPWPSFGIEDARELTQRASLRAASGRALFVLGVGAITTEAQQALLKLLEEPQAGVRFVLLAPHGVLLPTVRSRLAAYPTRLPLPPEPADEAAAEFLAQPYAARSEWVGAFLKRHEETAREAARSFLNALEAALYARLREAPSRELREALEDIGHFRPYLADRAPSLKMILEHLAATLPTIK